MGWITPYEKLERHALSFQDSEKIWGIINEKYPLGDIDNHGQV